MTNSNLIIYGLKDNPFPIGPAEDLNLADLIVARIEQYDTVISDFDKFKDLSNSKFRFIVTGPWGSGKSLMSLYYAKLLKETYGEKFLMLSIAPTPADVNEITRILFTKLQDFIDRGVIRSIKKSYLNDTRKSVLDALKKGSFSEAYHTLTNLFTTIIDEDDKVIYIRFDQLESAINQCKHDQDKMQQLAEFLRNFSFLGEELEKKFAVGIAVLDSAWAAFSKIWGSVEGIPIYKLSHLSQVEEVKLLLSTYLKKARLPFDELPEDIKARLEQNEVYPFTDDALETLLKVGEGRPRYICRYAHFALQRAAKSGFNEIGSEIIMLVVNPDYRYWLEALDKAPRRDRRFFIEIFTEIFENARKFIPGFEYSLVTKKMKKELAKNLGIEAPETSDGKFVKIPADWLIRKDDEIIAMKVSPRSFLPSEAEKLSGLAKVRVHEKEVSKVVILSLMDLPLSTLQLLSLLRVSGINVDVRKFKEDPDNLGRLLALWLRLRGELPGYLIYEEKLKEEVNKVLHELLGII